MTNYAELIAEVEKILSAARPDHISFHTYAKVLSRVAAALRECAPHAGARSEVTREAVMRRLDESPINAEWDDNTVLQVLDALSHFSPPPPPLPPICGMSVEEIAAEMEKSQGGDTPLRAAYTLIAMRSFAQAFACVAHHLAQPAPVVDPDAEAKRLAWEHHRCDCSGIHKDAEHYWSKALTNARKDFWRAVAVAKETS